MPPAKSGKSLSAAEIEKLGRWIDQGAKWQPHWSFIPPAEPAVPADSRNVSGFATRSTRSSRRGSSAKGSKPSGEAERGILIRRVTLDLTGLPPTPDEIDAFEQRRQPECL